MRRAGFSLLELMIATSLLLLVVAYSLQSFGVNQKTYVVTDQLTESQQNLRAVSRILEFDLRHAGLMVPLSAGACGIDNTNAADILYLSDAQAVDPSDDRVSYDGPEVQGAGSNVASGAQTLTLDSLVVEPAPARPAYDTDSNGTADSDFQVGGGIIIVDTLDDSRGVACGRVEGVDLVNDRIDVFVTTAPLAPSAGPVRLAAIPAIEYRTAAPALLLRNNVLMAKGIEDLQVAYFLDANTDNVLDPGELHGDGAGPDYQANAQSGAGLREVRANLVMRTRSEDREFTSGRFQPTENRTAVAGLDGYRRRVHTSTVIVRNVGQRMNTL